MKKVVSYLFIGMIIFMSLSSYAFKLDTHIWVGQQVINDLEDDGRLTIKLGGSNVMLDVDEDVKNAILSNKSAFLMGNIGPDAAPDVVVGQTTVHPGVKDENNVNIGWQTNDWLEYLLLNVEASDIGKAYTYGYLGHAAADVFAHTYVNQYAGDVFSLTDKETLVEQRHFVLENYIGKYTPPLKDHQGKNLGSPWQLVEMNDELATFVRDTLIYNDEVQDEYWKVPTANHLAAYYAYRKGIDDIAEDGIWHDIDVAITILIAAYFGVELTDEEASEVVDAAQKVADEVNRGAEDVQQLTNDIYDGARKYDERVFGKLKAATAKMQNAEQSWLSKHQQWQDKAAEAALRPLCSDKKVCPVPKFFGKCPVPRELRPDTSPLCSLAESLHNEAQRLERELFQKKNDFIQSTFELRDEQIKAIDSVHTIQNSLLDLQQLISADVNPVQALLRGWRSDVDIALTEYVKAANQAMVNTMNPAESAIDPIIEWFECYHMSIIGIPSSISGCDFRDSIGNLTASLENTFTIIDDAAASGSSIDIPNISDLRRLKDELIDDLVDSLKEEVAEEIIDLLPEEVKEILVLLDLDINDTVLNQYFTKTERLVPPKGLIMIGDMADRVKAEMHTVRVAPGVDSFDPNKYAVAYNAVVLAKLALLDNNGFRQLAILAGSSSHNEYSIDNLVAGAFGNIDGNHQWMPLPPPLPNSFSLYPPVTDTYSSDRSQLLGGTGSGMGFIPWKGDMREKLFRGMFIGPISPGIDTPSLINKTRIVESAYPYQPCSAYPFPSDIDDRTCVSIMLIPILSILLN